MTIQKALIAPKSERNDFGKYNYRSVEAIYAAVKPLLNGCDLYLTDEIVMLGNRFYVKATATLTNGKESVSSTAYAREEETKKGMDASQITGSASSYARKYALCGLFLIDGEKDADALNTSPDYTAQPTASATQFAPQTNTQQDTPADIIRTTIAPAVAKATTMAELLKIYNQYPTLNGTLEFKNLFSTRRKQLEAVA